MHLHDMQRRMMLPAVEGVGRRMMMMAKAAESFVVNDGDVESPLLPLQLLTKATWQHPIIPRHRLVGPRMSCGVGGPPLSVRGGRRAGARKGSVATIKRVYVIFVLLM